MTRERRTEVLVFGFDEPDAQYEGRLIGALERAESGGAIRVVEVLFVGREAESGDLAAVRLKGGSAGIVAAMAEFRIDARRRDEMTERALADGGAGALRELAAAIAPGAAVAAVLVEHRWADDLYDAVARSGGRPSADVVTSDDAAPALARAALAAVAP
jgi:hypothetical protein